MTKEQRIEVAIKNPETIAETEQETFTRLKAEELYYQSGGRRHSGVNGYEAGWKAAKAHYENRQ